MGFTAGTGGATAIQDVLNWSFAAPGNHQLWTGFTSSTGLALNGSATLNDGPAAADRWGQGERESAWYSTPVNIQSFTQDFTFQPTNAQGDGMAFVIQNADIVRIWGSGGQSWIRADQGERRR